MNQEIERKFLISVKSFKKLASTHKVQLLEQGYFVLKKDFHTRVRIVDNKTATITSKTGSGMVRGEFEQSLDLDHAKIIFSQCVKVLNKQRLHISYKGKTWDVDFFPDHDVAIAEIELSSVDEAFDLPPWIIREVTGKKKYSNIQMAKKPKAKKKTTKK